jgi:hypothetical protein
MAFGAALRQAVLQDPGRFDRIQILRDTIGPVTGSARRAIATLARD